MSPTAAGLAAALHLLTALALWWVSPLKQIDIPDAPIEVTMEEPPKPEPPPHPQPEPPQPPRATPPPPPATAPAAPPPEPTPALPARPRPAATATTCADRFAGVGQLRQSGRHLVAHPRAGRLSLAGRPEDLAAPRLRRQQQRAGHRRAAVDDCARRPLDGCGHCAVERLHQPRCRRSRRGTPGNALSAAAGRARRQPAPLHPTLALPQLRLPFTR